MANAELAMRIAAPADRVFAALTGPELMQLMLATYAEKVEIDSAAPGAGTVVVTTLRKGGVVRERVESIDPDERCMRYRVLDAGPLPYANYRGEARVQSCGPEACVVCFQCSFVPVDVTAAEAQQYWLDHNREVLTALRAVLEAK
jgi:Polyketide cyclase / dehydrase and lipid transport